MSDWEKPVEASLSNPLGAGVVVVLAALMLVVGVNAESPEARSQPLAASARVPVEDLRRERRARTSWSSRSAAVVRSEVSSEVVRVSPMEQWM